MDAVFSEEITYDCPQFDFFHPGERSLAECSSCFFKGKVEENKIECNHPGLKKETEQIRKEMFPYDSTSGDINAKLL